MVKFETLREGFRGVSRFTMLKVILAGGLLAYVISQLRWSDLAAVWLRSQVVWVVPTFCLYALLLWVMARRAWHLVGTQVPFTAILGATILQNVLSNLVATFAGMVSYITLLRAQSRVDVTRGVGSVLLARWGDLVALFPTLIVSAGLVWGRLGLLQAVMVLLLFGIGSLVILILAVSVGRRTLVERLSRVLSPFQNRKIYRRGFAFLEQVAALDPDYIRRLMWQSSAFSFVVLVLNVSFNLSAAQVLGISLDPPALAFVFLFLLTLSYIPIGILGNLGIFEFSTTFVLGIFGLAWKEALAVAIGMRLVMYLANGMSLFFLLPIDYWSRHKTHNVVSEGRT